MLVDGRPSRRRRRPPATAVPPAAVMAVDDLVGTGRVDVVDRHLGALGGESLGDRAADPVAGTGHQHALSRESSAHRTLLSSEYSHGIVTATLPTMVPCKPPSASRSSSRPRPIPLTNLGRAVDHIASLGARDCDLIVLPELWPCGFSWDTLADDARAAAEPLDGPRGGALSRAAQAAAPGCSRAPCRSRTDGDLFNTAVLYGPDGRPRAAAPQGAAVHAARRGSRLLGGRRLTVVRHPDTRATSASRPASTATSPRWRARCGAPARASCCTRRPTRWRPSGGGTCCIRPTPSPTGSGGSASTSAARRRPGRCSAPAA